MRKPSPSVMWKLALITTLACNLAIDVPTVWAQAAASSTIHGIVTDEQGLPLPGVTVTLTSPELQVREMTATTEPDGSYRFTDLPAGTFKVAFGLSGFRTFVRDEMRITIGFTARVDAKLTVGGIEESVT